MYPTNHGDVFVKQLFCGIDLGGTTINIGMIATDGTLVRETKIRSSVDKGVDYVVNAIGNVVGQCRKETEHLYKTAAVGIGVAGLVDTKRGILKEATNFPGWINVPLVELLGAKLNLPVTIDNDANVAALGEYTFGAGRQSSHMMMVTLGTGVGGGLILDGMIYRGAFGAAGEFGHITIKMDGIRCTCGRRGCIEAYVGSKALIRDAQTRLYQFPQSLLRNYETSKLTPKDVFDAAKSGDEPAQDVFRRAGDYLGYGLGNVVNLLNIERVVLGGGVALAGELLIEAAQTRLNQCDLNNNEFSVPIVKSRLGEHAGMVGAASLAMSIE